MKPWALLSLPLLAVLAGCGIYHYDYNVTPSLTGKPGNTTVAVVGVDDRNRESPGRFRPEYVGLFRDIMFAIPYFVHNKDKKAIADTLANDVPIRLPRHQRAKPQHREPASRPLRRPPKLPLAHPARAGV